MKSVFFFDAMLTPKIITFIYWLMILGCVLSGLTTMFSGWNGLTAGSFISGLAIILGGSLLSRIWCELMIVLFKIHENSQILARSGDKVSP